jgi:hypothetical protein
MKCRNLARGDLGCSKSSPTSSCRAPFLSCRAIARHPSLALGTASLTSFGTASPGRPPRLTPRGDTKKEARGDKERGLGATFPTLSSQGTQVPRDPSLRSGRQGKGARGNKRRRSGRQKGEGLGVTAGGLAQKHF